MEYPQKLFYDLVLMMRPFETQLNEILRSQGIQRSEWSVLYSIIHNPTLTAAELAQQLTIEKPNMTRIIKDLMNAGYMNVESSVDDKRRKNLLVTEAGFIKYNEIRVHIDKFEQEIIDGLTEDESKFLLKAIGRMKNNLTKRAGYRN